MTPLFKKLNFTNQKAIFVFNSPESFETELHQMAPFAKIVKSVEETSEVEFAMIFAIKQEEVNSNFLKILPHLKGDAILWMCYPKGSSKKYKCEFNRDNGWEILGKNNLEPVRMIAIDEDWSALRFRKVNFVKNITRRESFALTDEAKMRTVNKS